MLPVRIEASTLSTLPGIANCAKHGTTSKTVSSNRFFVCLEPIVEVKQENDWKCDWIFYLYFLCSFTIDTSKHNKNYIQTKNETF